MKTIEKQKLFEGYEDIKLGKSKASIYDDYIQGFYSQKPSLLKKISTPRDRLQMNERARYYVWNVGLLYRIIKMKVDFISAGFKPVHSDPKVQEMYEDIYRELDMETFVRNCAFEHEVIGEWYPFWNWQGNKPIVATLLNPELVEVRSLFGKEMIFLKPSADIQHLIQLSKSDKEIRRRLIQQIPVKFLNKWEKGEAILLDEDMSERYTNLKAYHEKYANSPLRPVFGDLELLTLLIEGDYSIAYKIKKAILQVKVGNERYNDGAAVDPTMFDQAEELFANPSQAMEVYTQWFMDADWIIPDIDIFGSEKYESVYRRILDWSGINVMLDEGGSFAQGYIKIKGLKQDVKNARDEIKKALDKFNRLIAEKMGLTTYGNKLKVPEIKFSDNALKDDKQIFDIVKFLYQHGVLSIEDTLDAFDYDMEVQLTKKEKENNKYRDKGVVESLFEANQGLLKKENDSSGDSPARDSQQSTQPRNS